MKPNLLWTLGAVALDSLLSLVGAVTLTLKPETFRRLLSSLASFGAGTMLGAAFLDLLPHALRESNRGVESVCLTVLMGLVCFVAIERFLSWSHPAAPEAGMRSSLGPLLLVSMGLHNFLDGALIAAAFGESVHTGLVTTLAIVFHEIPKELGDFAVLVHSGFTPRRALFWNLLSALTSVVGALVMFLLSSSLSGFTATMVPFTVGGFLFIGSRLLFELEEHEKRRAGLLQLASFAVGVALIAVVSTYFRD